MTGPTLPIQRRGGEPSLIAWPIDVTCMIGDHGRLYAYQTMEGKLAVRPCDACLAAAVETFKAELRDVVAA